MSLPDIDNIPESGAVFTIGRSRFADNVASHFFIRRDPVVTVACGDEHSAVICQSGRLFVFGSNGWGQLGLGHKNHVSKPSCVKILKPENVTHVACGRAHTLICTDGQKIFACGSDQEGQLGRGSLSAGDSSSSPVLIYDYGLAGPRIVQLAAGSQHSMVLTSDGGVLAWGSNLEGQLGLSGVSGLVNKPMKVPIPEPVKQISAGYYHSAFLTESGTVYVCGESESGKLGIAVNFSSQVVPKQLQLPITAVYVACGGHHTLVLADNGNVYCFGSNISGQLGMGTNVTEAQTPKLLPRGVLQTESIFKIACGESHTAIVTESGKLFTCGDGRHGKLGLEENENNVHELTFAARYQDLIVTNVCCGGCHTILVCRKRATSNERIDSAQLESIVQRKNSLPPLKVPLNRFQNEAPPENIDAENEKSSNLEAVVTEMPKNIENVDKSTKDGKIIIDKPETPKTMSDYYLEDTSKMREEIDEKVANEGGLNSTDKDPEKVPEMDDSLDRIAEKGSVLSVKSVSSDKDAIDERHSVSIHDERESSLGKSVSSGFTTPPPKPPRQKIGITNTLNEDRTAFNAEERLSLSEIPKTPGEVAKGDSPKSRVSSNRKFEVTKVEEDLVDTLIRELEMSKDEDKSMEREDNRSSPVEKLTNSKRLSSTNSKTGADEIVEADRQKDIEDVKKTEEAFDKAKEKAIHSPDDSDVVSSSVPKTGKMAKLFKSKKQSELENGTRCGVPSAKLKSKMCTVL